MNNIIIEVERKTGKSFCENNKIGVQHSNLQNKIIYKLDEMINGVAWLEYEIDGRKHFAKMDAIDMGYQIDIKSCLLVSDYVNVDLKITENENANGIPIFVSTITELDVYESIGASDEEPEEYPSWLDEANAKIDEITTLDNTILQHENIRVQNETTRVQNENERISNENQRVISENQRVTSEETRLSNEETRINNDIARETRIENLENNKADKTEIPDVSSFINKNVNDLINYELKTNTGSLISLNINSSNYVITIQLKNSDGTVISTDTIDLPLESVVVGGRYDNNTKKIILTLENGNVVDFSVADLVSGLQTEITSNNMLESDLVDDSNSGHKFVSTSEKNNWNGKQDKLKAGNNISIENNVINATDTTYDVSNSSKDGLMSKSDKSKLDSINVNNLELKLNKVTEISNTSTNDEYPGAKCVYDSQESQNTLIEHLQTENLTLKNIINNIYDLENILPNEIEESNEDITFNNTMNKAPLNITLKGNTEQITYTGKNLFDYTTTEFSDASNVNIETSNNVVTITTTNTVTSNNLFVRTKIPDNILKNGSTYIISSVNVSGVAQSLQLQLRNKDGSYANKTQNNYVVYDDTYSLYVTGNIFSTTSSASIPAGTTAIIKNIQVEESATATDYEPYVGGTASPNPNYPQDIKVVKGDNTINIIGKNLFDKDNANVILASLDSTTLSPRASYRTLYIPITGGEIYTISKIASTRFRVATTITTPEFNVSVDNYIQNDNETSITITTSSTANYLCVCYHITTETLTEQEILDSIQIEKGSTATDYEPFKNNIYEINLGKNLLNLSNKIVGYGFDNTNNVIVSTSNFDIYYIPVTSLLTYVSSVELGTSTGNIAYAYSNEIPTLNTSITNRITTDISVLNNGTFTAPSNIRYLLIRINRDSQVLSNWQIERGTQATSYSPYKTPIELCKIGDYQDYIYKDNDKWYLKKNIGKVNFNEITNIKSGPFAIYNSIPNIKYVSSNSQIGNGLAEKYKIRQGSGLTVYPNYFAIDVNRVNVNVGTDVDNASGLFYYELATPTLTEITDTELINQLNQLYNAYSYHKQTNIYQNSSELPFYLNVKAMKEI